MRGVLAMLLELNMVQGAILAITTIVVASVVGLMAVVRPRSASGRSGWELLTRRRLGEGHRPRPHGRSYRA